MTEKILGKKYELSLVFVGETRMKSLNKKYRKKNSATDILAFPISETSGEIFINQNVARKKAEQFSLTKNQYIAYVFIHGLLHLKGYDHGRTMERLEDTWCRKFGVQTPTR